MMLLALSRLAAAQEPGEFFESRVRPVLSKNCFACHTTSKLGGLQLDSREHLLQATRIHEDIFDRSIDVQVLRLRRKLEQDPSAPSVIQTARGVGYVFAMSVEPF